MHVSGVNNDRRGDNQIKQGECDWRSYKRKCAYLNRFPGIAETKKTLFSTITIKFINNFFLNFAPNRRGFIVFDQSSSGLLRSINQGKSAISISSPKWLQTSYCNIIIINPKTIASTILRFLQSSFLEIYSSFDFHLEIFFPRRNFARVAN